MIGQSNYELGDN